MRRDGASAPGAPTPADGTRQARGRVVDASAYLAATGSGVSILSSLRMDTTPA
jgi:hypothetical protein